MALLGLLSAQLILLSAQLRHVRSQDRSSKQLLSAAVPVLAPLPPALHALTPTLHALSGSKLAQTARLGRALALDAAPVLSALNASNLPYAFGQLTALAASANNGNVLATVLDTAAGVLSAVRRTNLVNLVAGLARAAVPDLAELPRLAALLSQAMNTLDRSLATQRRSLAAQRQSLAVQKQSLAIQRETLAILKQSLAIQKQVLAHAASLDRKVP
jgi:hypothetical protein